MVFCLTKINFKIIDLVNKVFSFKNNKEKKLYIKYKNFFNKNFHSKKVIISL